MSSLRARRMARNHKRMARPARLNLVALMDIFTILVLFLMVNNGDVEVLQSDRNIELPTSVSEQRPEETLLIKVSPDDIFVQGKPVVSVEEAQADASAVVTSLQQVLLGYAQQAGPLDEEQEETGRSIVIMGDQDMSYSLLQRLMRTCADTDYRDISLAVNSVPVNVSAEELATQEAIDG